MGLLVRTSSGSIVQPAVARLPVAAATAAGTPALTRSPDVSEVQFSFASMVLDDYRFRIDRQLPSYASLASVRDKASRQLGRRARVVVACARPADTAMPSLRNASPASVSRLPAGTVAPVTMLVRVFAYIPSQIERELRHSAAPEAWRRPATHYQAAQHQTVDDAALALAHGLQHPLAQRHGLASQSSCPDAISRCVAQGYTPTAVPISKGGSQQRKWRQLPTRFTMTTLSELKSELAELDRLLNATWLKEREDARRTIAEMAVKFQLSAATVAMDISAAQRRAELPPPTLRPPKVDLPLRSVSTTLHVENKYRNPATGDSWKGRGPRPRWLREALEAGATLENFRVHERQEPQVGDPLRDFQDAARRALVKSRP